jgi:hypothetical protein
MRALLSIALWLGTLGMSAADEPKPTEMRNHFSILGESGEALYDITEVIRLGEDFEENHLLIHDEGHGDFLLNREWNYRDQIITYRMNDLKNRAFIQQSSKAPFNSKTRVGTLAEAKRNPNLVDVPAVVKIETNGGEWEGIHTDWDEYSRLRRFRHDLRQTLDPFMLEALERMRGTILTLPGMAAGFYQLVGRFIIYDQRSDETLTTVKQIALQPDCDFDKAFGYPCSEKQLERVSRAAKEGLPLSTY